MVFILYWWWWWWLPHLKCWFVSLKREERDSVWPREEPPAEFKTKRVRGDSQPSSNAEPGLSRLVFSLGLSSLVTVN